VFDRLALEMTPFWYLTYFWFFTFLVKNKLHKACGMKVEMEARIIGRAPKPWGLQAWEGGKVGKWGSLREPTDVRSGRGGMAEMRFGRFCGLGGL